MKPTAGGQSKKSLHEQTRENVQEPSSLPSQTESRLRELLDNMQEGYYETDLKGIVTGANAAFCRILGYRHEAVIGMDYRDILRDEAHIEKTARLYRRVYETRSGVQQQEWHINRADGSEAILEGSVTLTCNANGEPIGFHGILWDVTERKQTEKALREAEARYRELFENAHDIVYTHDLSGKITSLNHAGELLSGYSRDELTNGNLLDFLAPGHRAMAQEMIARKLSGEAPTSYESAIQTKSGDIVPIEISTRLIHRDGKPYEIQGIARDITERKRAEEERAKLEAQILHSQKLESLGVLAGGIAHDFNNLLVGILGNAALAKQSLSDESPVYKYIRRVESTAQRAAELTHEMLAYSGRGSFVKGPVDMSNLAQEMGELLKASISKKARLQIDCDPNLPFVKGDLAQLHQVLMNLIMNASDALGDKGGTIQVRTYVRDVDHRYLGRMVVNDELADGTYVFLEVADNGCGMEPKTQLRIFDPFFSTKFTGRGLGLAASLGIIRAHKGAVLVYSEPGQGTTFKVLLPVYESEHRDYTVMNPELPDDAIFEWRGTGTILLADDEETVREVASHVLEEAGFSVLSAANGKEALTLFKKHQADIVAVLLDLMMPVMNGHETHAAIHALAPDVPVILFSGYTQQDVNSRSDGPASAGFVQKPFFPRELLSMLKNVIKP